MATRRYWAAVGQPERTHILSRTSSYHGTHGYGTALAGIDPNRQGFGELLDDTSLVAHDSVPELEERTARLEDDLRIALAPSDPADSKEGAASGTHDISFYCDDIHRTVAELKARGVEFTDGVEDHGYGLVTHFKMPGDFQVQLYQPRYAKNAVKTKQPKKPATKKTNAPKARAARTSRGKASGRR